MRTKSRGILISHGFLFGLLLVLGVCLPLWAQPLAPAPAANKDVAQIASDNPVRFFNRDNAVLRSKLYGVSASSRVIGAESARHGA